ncbi:MAG: hypothetical protein ACRC6I_05690 [Paracoccaceae bacterium]
MQIRIVSLMICLACGPAQATTPIAEVICEARADMVERLSVQNGAQMTAMGVRDVEAVMEVWSDDQGRWTLVQSYANGQSCIVAMGTDWMPGLPPA